MAGEWNLSPGMAGALGSIESQLAELGQAEMAVNSANKTPFIFEIVYDPTFSV
jgi:hypothetical protein